MKAQLHHETPLPNKFNINIPLLGFAAILLALFAYGTVMTLLEGHHAWGTSNEMVWGLLITAYVYFAVGCTGLCLLSSLGHVFHVKAFEAMGIRPVILAITSMITAFIVIALELKYVLNLAIYFFISPNFKSVFILMGILYGIYLVFLIAELLFYALGKAKISRIFAIGAIITGVSATSNLGLVFGSQVARTYWSGFLVPVLFISSALVAGAAALVILYYFVDRDKSKTNDNYHVKLFSKLLAAFIGIFILINGFNMYLGYAEGAGERYEAAMFLLNGAYSLQFWVFEIGLFLVAIILALFFAKNQLMVMGSGVIALIAMMFSRNNFVTAGHAVSLTPDGKGPITMLTYAPTAVELSMAIGAVGIVIVGYLVLQRIFVFIQEKFAK
jgi:molybdopterin-containing oxidoreductase family membrane subunit